jgi:acetyltransferase-like isoleucine patch superfamily enzyme
MIRLGINSYCYGVQRGSANDVIVGNYSSIAENVIFDGGFNHNPSFISTFPFNKIWTELKSNILLKGDIIIGSDVWIGEGATIFSGVKIGHGAIIGLNTIVTKDVEPYSVVVGAPMKVIRKRYSEEQITKLLKIEWWNFNENEIKKNVNNLMSDDIDSFLNLYFNN